MDKLEFNTFKRVDSTHPLDFYTGIDELSRPTLFLICDNEPSKLESSQIINVFVGKRKDYKWGISFTLLDSQLEELFSSFCKDIIDSSRSLKDKKYGSEFICNRYEQWQRMLSKSKGEILSESYIKGLVGELYFLKEYLIPLYGQEKAINSWIGPDKADQDFVCDNLWYEVKAVVSGSENVSITSIEQLDTPNNGELVIVYLDKTSTTDDDKLTLNSLFNEISESLSNVSLKNKFSEILLRLNYYPRPEYDQPAFKYSKLDRYKVDKDFSCIRRASVPYSVVNTKYDLLIALLKDKLIEKL